MIGIGYKSTLGPCLEEPKLRLLLSRKCCAQSVEERRKAVAPKMKFLLASLLVGCPALSQALTLYATHYSGHLYTLEFDPVKQKIQVKHKQDDCGISPSWLTIDRESKTLYCLDESGNAVSGISGNLTTYLIAADGMLAKQVQVKTLPGAVHGTVYGKDKKFIALAN